MRPDAEYRSRSGSSGPSPPPLSARQPPATTDRLHLVALGIITAALVVVCLVLAIPLLHALTWGAALAVIAWPLHDRVARRLGRLGAAALVSTALVVALILVPVVFVTYEVAREAAAAAEHFQGGATGEGLHERVAQIPGLGRVAQWASAAGIDLQATGRELAGWAASSATGVAAGSARAVVQALVAVVVLFFLLRDRAVLARGLRRVLPLSDAELARVAGRAADSVHANLYANVFTSLLDAVGAGLVFWAVGLPAPVLWGAVTFVVTLLPLVGSAGVWVPAATYLALTGRWLPAAVIAMWGVATWALVDHILYVRLVGGRLRMHPLLLLIAILGGLALFGASGLILGPGILAVTEAFLDIWEWQAGPELEPAQRASTEPPMVATRHV